jgi:8-oxo-dGTP pyrophosphatase MutT (NUDIX family)
MYKVFFRDRTVHLGSDLNPVFAENGGLFYGFQNREGLKELLDAYFHMEAIKALSLFHTDPEELQEAFRSCFHCIMAAGGVVKNTRDEFLVIKRKGIWDLPKGKLEKGEDFESAALREVSEETGLKELEMMRYLTTTYHTYELPGQKVLKETRWFEMCYHGQKNPELQEKEGITDYRWARPGKSGFIRKNTYPSILDVLEVSGLL